MASSGGRMEEARPFPRMNGTSSLGSSDSCEDDDSSMAVTDQRSVASLVTTDSRGKPSVHPGDRIFSWGQPAQPVSRERPVSGGADTDHSSSGGPVTLTHLSPISPSHEDIHSADQYKHPQPTIMRYQPNFPPGSYYYSTGGFPAPTIFTMPENEKYRKMYLKKQKRANKKEKNVVNSFRAENIEGHKDIDIDSVLQSIGETVEEDKKGKSKKVKVEKTKSGKRLKRKGSGTEGGAEAVEQKEAEEDKSEEETEARAESKTVRNVFIEEELNSFKQNFYLVNSDESRSREVAANVEESVTNSPEQSSFTEVTNKKNRPKKSKDVAKTVQSRPEQTQHSYQHHRRDRDTAPVIVAKRETPEPAPVDVPVKLESSDFPSLMKEDFPALPGGEEQDDQEEETEQSNTVVGGAWAKVVLKPSDNNNDLRDTDHDQEEALDNQDQEEVLDNQEDEKSSINTEEVDLITVIQPEVPKEEENLRETRQDNEKVDVEKVNNDDEAICDVVDKVKDEKHEEVLTDKVRVIATEEEFDLKETNKNSPVVIFSEDQRESWSTSEFTFGFDVNEDLLAHTITEEEKKPAVADLFPPAEAGQYWSGHHHHVDSSLPSSDLNPIDHVDQAILSFGAQDSVRPLPLIVGVPVGVPIPVSSYPHTAPLLYPVTAAGPVLQYPPVYSLPFPAPHHTEDHELAAKIPAEDQSSETDHCTISPESGISSSSPLSWQPDASPSLHCGPGPGYDADHEHGHNIVSQVTKSLSDWKAACSDTDDTGPGWATQVEQDSGLSSEHSNTSNNKQQHKKTEKFNLVEIVNYISGSWSTVSEDRSVPVFSAGAN